MLNYAQGRMGLFLSTLFASIALGSAFALEHFAGYNPCILCWTQRAILGAFIAVGLYGIFFLPATNIGHKIYSGLINLIAFSGVAIAIRHVYILFVPPEESCGFGAEMIFDMLPWKDAIMEFIKGSPTCSETQLLLGIDFPYWGLATFIVLAVMSVSFARHKRIV